MIILSTLSGDGPRQRENNLDAKQRICVALEHLADTNDGRAIRTRLKELQGERKAIGPVPREHNDALYARYRAACEGAWNRAQDISDEKDRAYIDSLRAQIDKIEDQVAGHEAYLERQEVYRMEGGKVAEHWVELDLLGLLRQLGAIPAPGTAGS